MGADAKSAKAIDVVRAFIAAINSRNPATMAALMTEDHTFIDSAGRIVSGRQDMTTGWLAYFGMFPDYEIRIDNMLSDGPRVAVFGLAAGTYNGRRGLVPENRIEMPAAWQAVVAGDKIKIWQVYADWTAGFRIMDEDQRTGQTGAPGRA